jgi:hypothetical protein
MGKRARKVTSDLNNFLEKVMKDLGTTLNNKLTEETPEDTGWAENNWIANLGTPHRGLAGTREAAEKGSIDFVPRRVGLAKIAAYKLRNGKIHITNNVYYLSDLNEGTSKQAPAMFIEMAIDKSIRQVIK